MVGRKGSATTGKEILMAGVNKVILIGRLGAAPEQRSTASGKAVTKFRIATDTGSGEKKQTDWHSIVTFDRTAELCAKYLDKGRQVYIEGRIRYNKWTKQDGTQGYSTEIYANDVQFLDSGSRSSGGPGSSGGSGGPDYDDEFSVGGGSDASVGDEMPF